MRVYLTSGNCMKPALQIQYLIVVKMYSIVLELVVHEFIVSAFLCLVQRCNNPHKTFFSSYDLTLAKVPHAEIPFQYLLFFFFFQSKARRVPRHKSLCVQQAVLNIVTRRCAVLSLLEPRISAQCLWITKLLLYCTSCQPFLFI